MPNAFVQPAGSHTIPAGVASIPQSNPSYNQSAYQPQHLSTTSQQPSPTVHTLHAPSLSLSPALNTPASFSSTSIAPSSSPSAPSTVTPILLVCGPNQVEVWSSSIELADCLAYTASTADRYLLPNIDVRGVELFLHAIRTFSSAPSNMLPTLELLTSSQDLGLVLDVANILQHPVIFLIVAAKIFLMRGKDLAFLHQLLNDSFMSTTDRVTHSRMLTIQSIILQQRKIMPSDDPLLGNELIEALKSTCNMWWYQATAKRFPEYKQHLKRRTIVLHSASQRSITPTTIGSDSISSSYRCSWLESAPLSPTHANSNKKPAPPAILWCRIFFEQYIQRQVLTESSSVTSAAAPESILDHHRQLWSSVGFLIEYLHIDASGLPSSLTLNMIKPLLALLKECTHIQSLTLTSLPLDGSGLLFLLATSVQLRTLHLQSIPLLSHNLLNQLQLSDRFPQLKITVE